MPSHHDCTQTAKFVRKGLNLGVGGTLCEPSCETKGKTYCVFILTDLGEPVTVCAHPARMRAAGPCTSVSDL